MREFLFKVQIMLGESTTGHGGRQMLIGSVAMFCIWGIASGLSSDAGRLLAIAALIVVTGYVSQLIKKSKD